MRYPLHFAGSVLLIATVLVFGCSRMDGAPSQAASDIVPPGSSLSQASKGSARSSPDDQGDLIRYSTQSAVRRENALTWHMATLSEAHAMRAILSGEMTVSTPDGEPIQVRYLRHVEHPNGNWTWFGRSSDGGNAIVTFGEHAVFGTIATAASELRLTTLNGRSWVAVVDAGKERHPIPKAADYFVPPELAGKLAPQASAAPVSASATAVPAAVAAATTTVDVAIGYTTGFASELGGDSQAITRLQHLVDVANQAYANSQISAQLRMVKTMPVSYPDNTSNDDLLSKLTGYKSGTGTIPVDPAFTALRTAREQYGADLVSVVRRFRTPENVGCGVAWLIGGNQTSIDSSDSPWGYSAVSDDIDKGDINETDGQKYVCRKETLAHELGHNMGQTHNVEDAGGDSGAHAYSYGYRETLTNGFYTVMAYRLAGSTQRSVPYFANPNVNESVSGRPTGVANTSDNARSMAQTMPIIATFRAAVVPPQTSLPKDVDGDQKEDILWNRSDTRELYSWMMNGSTPRFGQSGGYALIATAPIAVDDFNGDGRADILLSSGQLLYMYTGNGAGGFNATYIANAPAGWDLLGTSDVNADEKADLIWFHAGTRELYYWLMDGDRPISGRSGGIIIGGTSPMATGDFGGDGRADVLLASTGNLYVLTGTANGTFTAAYIAPRPSGWNLLGARDVDADGKTDLIWFNPVTRELYSWSMSAAGPTVGRSGGTVLGGTNPLRVGDYNGDERADILLSSGANLYMLTGAANGTYSAAYVAPHPAGWSPL